MIPQPTFRLLSGPPPDLDRLQVLERRCKVLVDSRAKAYARLEAFERFSAGLVKHHRDKATAWCIVACVLSVVATVEAIALGWLP